MPLLAVPAHQSMLSIDFELDPKMNIRALVALVAFVLVPINAYCQIGFPRILPTVARPGPGEHECKKPEYPKQSLRHEEQGVVTIKYLLDKDGAILEGKVVKSSGFFELDKAAFVGLAKCAYKIPDGMQEPTWISVQYVWKLGS